MADDAQARKLATIVALDVAGYSARTEADEARTADEVAALRKVIEAIVVKHGGDARRARAAEAAFAAFPRLERIAATTRAAHTADVQDYGAIMHTRSGVHRVAPVALAGNVDRVGMGDAFAAGVVHALLVGEDDAAALAFGHAAACLTHSIPGDFLPFSAAEVHAAAAGGLDVKR